MPSHSPIDSLHHLRIGDLASVTKPSTLNGRYFTRIAQCLFLLISMALGLTARADTVTLANGDRLTGTIVKSDGKQLTLKTDFAGCSDNPAAGCVITLQWPAVRQITSSGPLYVVTPQGATVGGTVTTEGTDVVVAPSTGAPQRIPLANITTPR
jgi:hypothetical protein